MDPTPHQPDDEPFEHRPVMLDEVVDLFAVVPAGWLVDATLGGGGHAGAILAANPALSLLGLDRDTDALRAAERALAPFEGRVSLRHRRFDRLAEAVAELGAVAVTGVLFDLGVSSPQLDRAERGFSYRADAPLDMRMDRSQTLSAAEVVNSYTEVELATILHRYGDERHAGRIARAIVAARPIATTGELAEVIRDAIPAPARRRGGHPAKRSFQAVRIEVNGELDVLGPALDQAVQVLAPGGRCAVIAYHSGEDRIAKERFRHAATGGCTCPPRLPCGCGARPTVRLLKQGAWKPSADEAAGNPRASSARLRAVEKLPVTAPDAPDLAPGGAAA
jgi:16S rRNA (cytosine1402-N4)-methyltransferase